MERMAVDEDRHAWEWMTSMTSASATPPSYGLSWLLLMMGLRTALVRK